MNRVSFFGGSPVLLRPFRQQAGVRALTLSAEELYAGKIMALLDRAAARDLYDTYRLVQGVAKVDENILRQGLLAFGLTITGDFRTYTADCLDLVKEKSILTELYPTLRKQERPKLGEMIKAVRPLLKRLTSLSAAETTFFDRFYAGDFKPEQIFFGELLDRVRIHPAIQWQLTKMQRRQSR